MLVLLLISVVQSTDVTPPSSLLGPRRFHYHAQQYLQEISPEPTKQGPVLFPNDAPPPPRPPLVVTSRPISESIARSDLNPVVNNSIAEPSQVDADYIRPSFRLKPEFLRQFKKPKNFLKTKINQYAPYSLPTAGPSPDTLDVDSFPALLLSRSAAVQALDEVKNNYGYGKHADIPPIYKALGNHVLKQHVNNHYDVPPIHKVLNDHIKDNPIYAPKGSHASSRLKNRKEPKTSNQYQHHDITDVGDFNHKEEPKTSNQYQHHAVTDVGDYDQDSNYAFSYRVKDQKTGDDFSHSQQSTGSATNGEYRVRLPDGRMQIVSYTADENGYKADVRYDEDYGTGNIIDADVNYNHNKLNFKNYYKYVTSKENSHTHSDQTHNIPEPKLILNYKTYQDVLTTERNDNYEYPDREIEDYRANYNYDLPRKTYDYYNFNPNYDDSDKRDENKREQYKPVREDDDVVLPKELEDFDYSVEHDGKSDAYSKSKSKFTQILPKNDLGTIVVPNIQNEVSSTTLKPSYDELRAIFAKNTPHPVNLSEIFKNVELNFPSTTPSNFVYNDGTTELVVLIAQHKPKFYTDTRDVTSTVNPVAVTPIPATPLPVDLAPRNYLVSTIANLKNGQKPVLSDSFKHRIQKYLTFN